jgi:hypothetical protein
MKKRLLTMSVICLEAIIMLEGCNVDDSYSYAKEFHNKYEQRLDKDSNYKLNVKDLNIRADISDNSIFCYSTATTMRDKVRELIKGLREIPIDCNGGISTDGGYECLLDVSDLDNAADDRSAYFAQGNEINDEEIARNNGYVAETIRGGTFVQEGFSEAAMIDAIEKKMKTDSEFCSYIVSKTTKDLGVGYYDQDGKRYWSFMLGDRE